MSEIEKLLFELRQLKENKKIIPNNKETWKYIGKRDWTGAGFDDENEARSWMENNEYSNI